MFAKSEKTVCSRNPPHHTLEKPPLPCAGTLPSSCSSTLTPAARLVGLPLSGCLTTLSRLSQCSVAVPSYHGITQAGAYTELGIQVPHGVDRLKRSEFAKETPHIQCHCVSGQATVPPLPAYDTKALPNSQALQLPHLLWSPRG